MSKAESESIRRLQSPDRQVRISAAIELRDTLELDNVAYSEIELARRFAEYHGDTWKYCAVRGCWFAWNKGVWLPDETLHAYCLARHICRDAAADLHAELLEQQKDRLRAGRAAASVSRASTVAGVERLARADRKLAITIGQLDADPWSLNTRSGIVDLRTGEIRPHDPAAFCTKITGGAPGQNCPRWQEFLSATFGGDSEVIGFLQRLVGYCATGETREHVFAFGYGPGGNGKSVLLNTISEALGDYAITAPMETFVVSATDKHPTDLAMLRGARLVVATETEEGRRWAESKLKALTGGDRITARFMRQDFFTYVPQFKLFVIGNHKPSIRNVDQAMRRRLMLIPFNNRPASPDKDLTTKLRAELNGILGWIITGCLQWQSRGLEPPPVIRRATEQYFEAEDGLGRWLAECVAADPSSQGVAGIGSLFASWTSWAQAAGEFVGSQKRFGENMRLRGFDAAQDPRTRRTGFRGLRIRVAEDYGR